MEQKLRAIYRSGAFVVRERCDLPEEAEVQLVIQGPVILHPEVTDPAERLRLLKKVAKRMRQNPIPRNAGALTRQELHERP